MGQSEPVHGREPLLPFQSAASLFSSHCFVILSTLPSLPLPHCFFCVWSVFRCLKSSQIPQQHMARERLTVSKKSGKKREHIARSVRNCGDWILQGGCWRLRKMTDFLVNYPEWNSCWPSLSHAAKLHHFIKCRQRHILHTSNTAVCCLIPAS